MGKAFLKQQAERDQKVFEAGFDIGVQWVTDMLQASMRKAEAMGGKPWGRGNIERLFKQADEYDEHFGDALTGRVEADYLQEELDGILREIYEDDLIPFLERYPNIKRYGYKKARKGWK